MTIASWILSIVLVAEFVMAPINLWTGRTMANFTRFTGYSPDVAIRIFAPVKLLAAILVAVGVAVRLAGIAGAAVTTGVCAAYLIRLAAPGRRHGDGLAAFGIFGGCAVALLILQVLRST